MYRRREGCITRIGGGEAMMKTRRSTYDPHMNRAARGVAYGALIGAAVGLVLGLIVHAIIRHDDALVGYEFVGGLLGIIFGGGLGAFWGGMLNLPRGRQ